MQIFIAYVINNDFEKEVLKESYDLKYIKKFIEECSKTIEYPIYLDYYYKGD